MMITKPGIYELSADEYHADPTPEPSLSASVMHELLSRSPMHARHCHPRLNGSYKREHREIFDLGTASHAYLLEGERGFAIIDAEDWRTKVAKEARDAARIAGQLPILRHQLDEILIMANEANRQLDQHQDRPRPFTNGKPEQTLIWLEGDIWCRARLDWLHEDHAVIDDYKSTSASANPEAWTRTLYGAGADIQAAWYLRGLNVLTGNQARFRFVVQENFPPFALSVIGLSPMALDLAEKKIRFALGIWTECLRNGRWPAYPDRTCYAELPAYEEARWLAREEGQPR